VTGAVWESVHVFRHDDHDDLLLTQVAPLMAELVADGLVLGFFYLRYWDGGPHLRLRMRAPAARTGEVRARVTDRLGAHLRAHPSRHPMDPAGYERLAADFAAAESLSVYERHLLPPDTIRAVPYPPEHASFGHGPSLAAVERHFCASTAIALDTLRTPPSQRLSAAMTMTLATLLSLPTAPPGTPVPDRARMMMNGAPPAPSPTATSGTATDAATDAATGTASDVQQAKAAWARSRDELTAMAERLRTTDPATAPHVPVLAWLGSIRELRDRLTTLQLQGAFSPVYPRPITHALNRCLHLHLNRLGTSLTQEARLRRMAALTVDSLR
jgi:hypothetical protein